MEAHASLGGGMVHDQPRHLIADGFFDARDVLVDRPGIVRKRGGTETIMPIEEATFPHHLAYYASGDVDQLRCLYAAASHTAYADPFIAVAMIGGGFRKTSLTSLAHLGRPFRYGQTVVFPQHKIGAVVPPFVALAGSTFRRTLASESLTHASMSVTAGSAEVVIAAADAQIAQPGRIIFLGNTSATPDDVYLGRIVRRNADGTRIWVDPPVPFTAAPLTGASASDYLNINSPFFGGARVGCSWQNRIIVGGVVSYLAGTSTSANLIPERIMWSVLPGETTVHPVGGGEKYYGLIQVTGHGFDKDNFIDFPHLGQIVALAPTGPNELLVFGPERIDRIAGTLQTLDADVSVEAVTEVTAAPLSGSVGCLGERTVQETPFGVVWAAQDGVYLYNGQGLTNLMERRIQTFWKELQTRDGFQVYGSAIVRGDHYCLSTSDAHLMVNIRTSGWVRLRDDLTISSSTSDPLNPSRVYASSWTDPTGGSPGFQTTQVYRLDTILTPTGANAVDHDGQIVEPYLETKAYDLGDAARLKKLRRMMAAVAIKSAALDEAGTVTGLDYDGQHVFDLPNADAEFGTTDGWRATGSSASTVTADSSEQRSGAYSIKCVTAATGGGVAYDFPSTLMNSTNQITVEAWVKVSTAGTLTMDFGGTTTTTTTTGSWVRLAVLDTPGSGHTLNHSISFTHSASAATFYVDDVRARVLQPWWTTAATNGLVTGATATIDTETGGPLGLDQCFRVTTASGTQFTGISHVTRNVVTKKNQTMRGSIWIKNDAGNNDHTYQLRVGGWTAAGSSQSSAVTISPTTDWARFSVTHTPTEDLRSIFVTVRKTDTTQSTFYATLATVTLDDPQVDVALIGGLDAEGDYGDGTCEDIDFARLTTDYHGLLNPTTVTVSSGQLAPTSTTAKAFAYRRGFSKTRDGEATVTYVPGHTDDRIAILLSVLDASNYLFLEANGGGISSIQKVQGGIFTNLTDPASPPAAETIGVQYWLRGVRKGRLLTVEHWSTDPALGGDVDPILEHYLSAADAELFNARGLMGFRFQPGSTSMRVLGFRCEPYGNVGIARSDPSAPIGVRGDAHVITRAASVCFRAFGAATEVEFGPLDLHYTPLNPTRTS